MGQGRASKRRARAASGFAAGLAASGALRWYARLAPCLALGAALGAPAAAYAQEAARAYDIPAGTLEEVLARFGHEAGILLSFRPELTTGLRSEGLHGSYGVDDGLAALLGGSGLRATRQANGSYTLARPAPATVGLAAPLPQVTVTSRAEQDSAPYAGGQLARGGSLGILGTDGVLDVPFSTTNYTSKLLQDQQARSLADVVINDASVRMLTSTGGFGETYQIRGYNLTSGDVGVNGLFGLASGSRMPAVIVERVEVLKGPGTLMNGISPEGSIGGSINIVTKRAGDEPLTRLTTTWQSDNQPGMQADLGRRFGDDRAWGIRVNTAYRDGEGSIAGGHQKVGAGTLALDYRGAQLRWSLDAYAQHEDSRNFRPQVGFLSTVTAIPAAPAADFNFFPDNRLHLDDKAAVTRLEYDLGQRITAYGAIGYRDSTTRQNLPVGSVDNAGAGTTYNGYYDTYSKTVTADTGLRMQLDGAGVQHTISVGLTRLQQEAGNGYTEAATSNGYSIYTQTPLTPITAQRATPRKASDMTLDSVTLTDAMSMLDGHLRLFLGARRQGVRYDSYDTVTGALQSSYDASAISPLWGVVIKPDDNFSLYANYTAGLTRGTVVPTGMVNAGQILAPYRSRQIESGLKVDWGKLSTNVSVFEIRNPSAAITVLTDSPQTTSYGYDGEQRNRGLELSAYGELTSRLRLMASATFYDGRLTRTENHANDGRNAPGVPKHTFNLAADWDAPWLPGLAFNARMVHTSAVYFNAANTLSLPGWTRWDIGARYTSRISGKPLVLRLNVENLFNRNYWLLDNPYATVAAPRTVLLSAQVDF
ncbi:TonB-dependent receptor [Herbaspirillum sp. LeCh32-8]|uniref:TonB-dependent receptor n=1 Tax=Herbaspirillum sp. LeCh32-8 TaxID=2821356 RepID=UPI001AE1E812|nr:TonB-dependent receptor [Herbaspirillum sp. LeCh32-8]MBP0599009.1 TonB-dependent receptor [Herbaspirillum sp. LeCh32-8]